MVAAAKRTLIDDLQNAIRGAGLVPDQVVPGVLAPANAFEMAEPEAFTRDVVALVEIGLKNTTITVLDCGEIRLSRVLALGGDRLTGGLAETMGISYAEADSIKVGMPGEVRQHLEPLIQPLGRELRASIDFFENQHDRTVSQVFLSGGSARSEFITEILHTELLVPCKVWLPTKFLQLALEPVQLAGLDQAAPQLTVAIGAATTAF
jgi:type IV pilus assembly protein PilM